MQFLETSNVACSCTKMCLYFDGIYNCFRIITISVVFSVGAILAGLPFSYIAKQLEWKGAFILMEILLIGVLIMKIVMRKVEYKMVPTRKKLQ